MRGIDWREKEFLSVADIAGIFDVTNRTANEYIHSMPYIRIGKLLRVRREAFEAWVKERERKEARRHV